MMIILIIIIMIHKSMLKIYSVYYYQMGYGAATVKFMGMYTSLTDAKDRLNDIIPDYERHINNTVTNHGKIGWINRNEIGDFDCDLSASQPHSATNLFF